MLSQNIPLQQAPQLGGPTGQPAPSSFQPFNVGMTPTGENNQQTQSINSGGGIGGNFPKQGATTGYSSTFAPGQGALLPSSATNVVKPSRQKNPITSGITLSALVSDAQLYYNKSHPIFLKDVATSTTSYKGYALQNANYFLELTWRTFMEEEKKKKLQGANYVRNRKRTLLDDNIDLFPKTVEEFRKKMNFFGIFMSFIEPRNMVRERTVGIAVKYEVDMANIFGDVHEGDTVFLVVMEIDNPYSSFFDDHGKIIGAATPGKIPQIIGSYSSEGSYLPHSTAFGKPNPNGIRLGKPIDTDFVNQTRVRQQEYEEQDGFINWDGNKKNLAKPMLIQKYQNGYVINLGKVMSVNARPSEQDISMALRSFDHWTKLQQYHKVTILLNPDILMQVH